MKVEYKLTGAGWAECEITLNGKAYKFSAGYLTNAFGDILQALLDINPLYSDEIYKEEGASFSWDAEPIETDWHVKYLGDDKMQIAISEYEDSQHPLAELNLECSYDAFLQQWIKTAENILLEYGIVGYKRLWMEHEFPLSIYLQLKYYLQHKTEFPVIKETTDDIEILKSNIEMELNYLKKN
ncbi:hypothetical protein [Bacillus sp. NTK034]|uniref:hypothetical protein n=1 Tax=Bacillus sp. NTK034 TaxID=2802176 RepID=UPI001A8E5826|nr:hypothetical protein [Bacillus sp. NTK034]MBN8201440.1 hypothetical protein [Bacillus sp. NTK034]